MYTHILQWYKLILNLFKIAVFWSIFLPVGLIKLVKNTCGSLHSCTGYSAAKNT